MSTKNSTMQIQIGVRLDDTTNFRLCDLAEKKDRKPSELARLIIKDYLKNFYE